VLFVKAPDLVRPLASITKLMSAVVLADVSLDLSTTTEILASDMGGDRHVQVGERYTVEELWHVGLIASSNPAIQALVRMSGLSPEEFVARMNKKAEQLQLVSLKFVEPTGLNSGNVGNVQDVAQLLNIALRNKKIYQTLQMPNYTVQPLNQKKRVISSTDALLTRVVHHNFLLENIVGKTGYIEDAGYNFAVRLEDSEGHAVRIVLLGSASADSRFTESRDLAEWVFKQHVWPDQKEYASFLKH
jgi:D-alanyl-D-alanine endopeptidase (penicillin-binding protein 7)